MTFTAEAEPANAGIEVLDGSGTIRTADSVESSDSLTWLATFREPLAPGTVAVRWTMRAGDAHPRSGSFTFQLVEPVPAVEASPTPSPTPSTTVASAIAQDLEDFLDVEDPAGSSGGVATLGRIISMVGVLLGVGGLAFAASVLHATPDDVRTSVFWIRRFGVVAVLGAAIELVGQTAVDRGTWQGALSPAAYLTTITSGAGLAIMLRLGGGAMLTGTIRLVEKSAAVGSDVVSTIAARVPAAVGGRDHAGPGDGKSAPATVRLDRTESRWSFVAAMAMSVSFAFDGHTAVAGAWPVTALADVTHVVAAAIWAGGVVMLALVGGARRRRRQRADLLGLAVRFSVLAAVAVVAVGVAGLALTWTIIDAPSDLWSTSWGRLLLLKVLLVAVAGGFGYRNHNTLIPQCLAQPGDRAARGRLRRAVSIEAAILALVIVVTAVLVAASSS